MSWLTRLRNTARSGRLNDELDDELRFHLEQRSADLIACGMSAEEAAQEARRRCGNLLSARQQSRDVKLAARLESILADARFGFRIMAKAPLVTAAAILSLALAIGSCTASFSLLDSLVLRPLPVREPDRLVYLAYPGSRDHTEKFGNSFSYPMFRVLRDASRGYADLMVMSYQVRRRVAPPGSSDTEKLYVQWVSGNIFEQLGVVPAMGRVLTQEDDQKPGERPVAVLSYSYWVRRFGADPRILGRWLKVDDTEVQVVGVARRGFTGVEPGIVTDIWLPAMMWNKAAFEEWRWDWFRILGRLEKGATLKAAEQVLAATFTRTRAAHLDMPADTPKDYVEWWLHVPLTLRSAANGPSMVRDESSGALWVLAAVVGLVLLIACANVANLMLARCAARQREMALRVSIGAGRGRLIQQVLVECALLSLAALSLGALFGLWCAPQLGRMLGPSMYPVELTIGLDARVAGFLAVLCLFVTVLFGSTAALRASTVSPNSALSGFSSRIAGGAGISRALVALQVAFCFVVLFAAALLLNTFRNLRAVDLGFDPENLLQVEVTAKGLNQSPTGGLERWRELERRIAERPGVQSVGSAGFGLFSGSGWSQSVRIPGRAMESFEVFFLDVSPGFLDAMRMRLVAGRDFTQHAGTSTDLEEAIVNEAFVRRYYPSVNPLGARFQRPENDNRVAEYQIVGVVKDASYSSVRDLKPPTVYVALGGGEWHTLLVRTAGDPATVAADVRSAVHGVDPVFQVTNLNTQAQLVADTVVRERLLSVLSSFFALVSIVLAGLGLYGVVSYTAVQRTKEIGIRIALGSGKARVVRLVTGDVALSAGIGIVTGALGGVILSRYLSAILFETQPASVPSLALPAAVLLAAAFVAAAQPSWRAARIEPMEALRYE